MSAELVFKVQSNDQQSLPAIQSSRLIMEAPLRSPHSILNRVSLIFMIEEAAGAKPSVISDYLRHRSLLFERKQSVVQQSPASVTR